MTDLETKMESAAEIADAEYEKRLEAEADAAIDALQRGQSWTDWLKVGELFCHGRKQAMLYSHMNKPEGKGYNLWFSGWMARHPKLQKLDKATRNHAMQCYDNIAFITAWRTTLSDNQRALINHPTTVLRRWKATSGADAAHKAMKKQSAKEALNEQLAVLEADNKKLRDKIEKGGENIFALSDTPKDIALALAGNMSVGKLADVVKALTAELAAKRKREADRKRAGPATK